MAAASCHSGSYLGRFVVVVDEDIDPTNLFEVLWAMCTRCDPAEDIDIIRKMWSGPLDPRIPREFQVVPRGMRGSRGPLHILRMMSMSSAGSQRVHIAQSTSNRLVGSMSSSTTTTKRPW